MTLDRYTLAIFAAGVLTGVGFLLLARAIVDEAFVLRYLRRRRRKPSPEPRPLEESR